MTTPFPNLTPTSREFTLGDIPSTTYRSLSGAVFRRSFGNKPTGHSLKLTFKNIPDDQTAEILKHYNDSDGTFSSFQFDVNTFAAMETALKGLVKGAVDIKWRYSKTPKVTSTFRFRSTVTVDFIGELEA